MYYLNYLLKFYEHLDTYVLILKKKRVIFLHWYHHASTFLLLVTHIQIVTVLLTYIQLNTSTTVQWVPILCNVIVLSLFILHPIGPCIDVFLLSVVLHAIHNLVEEMSHPDTNHSIHHRHHYLCLYSNAVGQRSYHMPRREYCRVQWHLHYPLLFGPLLTILRKSLYETKQNKSKRAIKL